MAESSDASSANGQPKGGDPIQSSEKKKKTTAKKKASSSSSSSSKSQEWKVCKGYLYYSSWLRSHGRPPICFGSQAPLRRVPAHLPRKYKMAAARIGKLEYFKYACVGYSIFLLDEDSTTEGQKRPVALPLCAGYELLLGKQTSTSGQVPAHSQQKHHREDLYFLRSRTTSQKLAMDNFLGRFTRSAEVVASGVTRNLLRVGSYIKDNLDNMFYPDRRRPKS